MDDGWDQDRHHDKPQQVLGRGHRLLTPSSGRSAAPSHYRYDIRSDNEAETIPGLTEPRAQLKKVDPIRPRGRTARSSVHRGPAGSAVHRRYGGAVRAALA